jgi:GLPGLI family protein
MKTWITGMVCLLLSAAVYSQKIMTEGTVQYKITVLEKGTNPAIADAFAGAEQVLQVKGYKARLDFRSPLRTQTQVYDAQAKDGFVLRQAGSEKYLITLDASQWKQFHKRFYGMQFTLGSEQKEVAGYSTRKAEGKAPDGSEITAYYATGLSLLAKGYDPAFEGLPGLPLEIEVRSGGVVLRYEAMEVKMTMVSSGTFEMPKSGYKVLEFKQ